MEKIHHERLVCSIFAAVAFERVPEEFIAFYKQLMLKENSFSGLNVCSA